MTDQPQTQVRRRKPTKQDRADDRRRKRTNRKLITVYADGMMIRFAGKLEQLRGIEQAAWDEAEIADQGNEEI